MRKRQLYVCALWLVSIEAVSECMPTYCSAVKIQEMQVDHSGVVWIQTTGAETNLTNCVPESSVFIKVDTASTGGKNIYSALLSAQARDKAIKIRTMDNVNPCQAHYVVVE